MKYQLSNDSPNATMKRLAEMSCSRYWIERAFEDAKGEVRGWTGWHHHMTMVLLVMLFLLILQLKWKDKAPMLTIQDVRDILEVILPKRIITDQGILELIDEKHNARESARRLHHKKNSKAYQLFPSDFAPFVGSERRLSPNSRFFTPSSNTEVVLGIPAPEARMFFVIFCCYVA
jgi:hypothetical protein